VNEIWLDFTTDAAGAGRATSTVPWVFPADRRAASVIIHAMPTSTEPGKAGGAGNRAACLTVGF
jgi:superoxide dismutase, Cu-Zn family